MSSLFRSHVYMSLAGAAFSKCEVEQLIMQAHCSSWEDQLLLTRIWFVSISAWISALLIRLQLVHRKSFEVCVRVCVLAWHSLCQRSWLHVGSSSSSSSRLREEQEEQWRWTSTAQTPHRPLPFTTSIRDAFNLPMCTCKSFFLSFHQYYCEVND